MTGITPAQALGAGTAASRTLLRYEKVRPEDVIRTALLWLTRREQDKEKATSILEAYTAFLSEIRREEYAPGVRWYDRSAARGAAVQQHGPLLVRVLTAHLEEYPEALADFMKLDKLLGSANIRPADFDFTLPAANA